MHKNCDLSQYKDCSLPNKKLFPSLNVAIVASSKLCDSLVLDANIFLITRDNFKYVIKYSNIDFLLIESSVKFSIKDWDYVFLSSSEKNEDLESIVLFAKNSNVPVVFWETLPCSNDFLRNKIVSLCDFVFSSDPLANMRGRVEYLGEYVQPKIHNPYSYFRRQRKINEQIIVQDYVNSVDDLHGVTSIFTELKKYKLLMIDSNNVSIKNNLKFKKSNNIEFCGSVSKKMRDQILKKASASISTKVSSVPAYKQIISDLECMAMGVPVLYAGAFDVFDLRKDSAIECENYSQIHIELLKLEDEMYAKRRAHLSYRYVYRNHTISHRLNSICDKICPEKMWEEYPLVTLCFATCRESYIKNCLENYSRQNYKNKELVIVYNASCEVSQSTKNLLRDFDGKLSFFQVPRDGGLGMSLNAAVHASHGSYFFKMDDDDYYGAEYVSDMMLVANFFDSEVIGKPQNCFFKFDDEEEIYLRNNKRGDNYFVRLNDKAIYKKQIIVGNSISAKVEFLKANPFVESAYNHTDTLFFKLINRECSSGYAVVTDNFNMLVNRRGDVSSHTWKIDKEKLSETCDSGFTFNDMVI